MKKKKVLMDSYFEDFNKSVEVDTNPLVKEIEDKEAKFIRKKTENNVIQSPSSECHSSDFNVIQSPSSECHSITFNVIQSPFECHSKQPSLTEVKVLSFLNNLNDKNGEIKTTKTAIASSTGITIKGAETAIRRLISKGYLKKENYSPGRFSGFTKYSLTDAASKVLISISFNIIQPPSQPPSYKERNNKILSFFIPENLKNIGLKEFMIKIQREDIQETLNHLSYSLENKELKTTNPLATIISIINNGKNWVSGKFLEEENQILEDQKKRLQELQKIKQESLEKAYQIFKLKNPSFLEKIKSENQFLRNNEETANKIGFSKFLEQLEG